VGKTRQHCLCLPPSLRGALGGLLFGYDTRDLRAIGSCGSISTWTELATGWAAACALIGCAAGAAAAGLLSDRLGRRKVLMLSAVAFFVSAVGPPCRQFHAVHHLSHYRRSGIGAASMTSPCTSPRSPRPDPRAHVSVNQFAIVSGW